ncbi:MAG: YkgJ family cysteine cluster protein [Oscillospiraceae bacterium]|nr:YkgJ family cysteine cluster protein [Oscillospiraceae bacterium]
MSVPYNDYPLMKPSEIFQFSCQNCGSCCKKVRQAVMVESLDLFRLARHLQMDIADVAERYTEVGVIAWGAPVLLMKTTEPDDACVFLKDNRCRLHGSDSKPRACRLYPLSVGPDDDLKKFLIFKVSAKKHHYKGRRYRAQEWVAANFRKEDREYVSTEYLAMLDCGKIMRRIPRSREKEVQFLMLRWRYFQFETGQDFMRQFVRNMAALKRELEKLAK